ncbi:hypothetical protein BofuT4_uP121300.1 [Botrytis cinerea T4]|uniref:Uncharacterized protein n=1 Tax=Botryotinia fuckeliana (strain T4) TaxID=999810 RepID=G2YNB3_BOTF4|nr:hypothetical protein BofuT4_uP121300.1 [Botrytis cinerea T4]
MTNTPSIHPSHAAEHPHRYTKRLRRNSGLAIPSRLICRFRLVSAGRKSCSAM